MQQIYIKKFTKQDITRSVSICTESVESFWGVAIDSANEYHKISICNEKNPTYFPNDVTIHKGNNGEKDWRITGNGFKPLYKDDNPEENDLFVVKKNYDKFVLKLIKKGTAEYDLFLSLFKVKDNYVIIKIDDPKDFPLQQIYYGAPGTGKSHETNKIVSEYSDTIRTTFHPDSDYASFVGCYKPTMIKEYMYGLNGDKTIQFIDPKTDEPLSANKIAYKFVKQAFLKAYIKAWQKMSGVVVKLVPLNFNVGNDKFTITSIEEDILKYTKESPFEQECIRKTWDCLWESGKFVIPIGPQPGQSVQQAVSQWIYDNIESCKQEDFDNGWNNIIDKLQKGEDVIVQKKVSGAKQYKLSLCGEATDIVLVLSEGNKKRNRIKECYENNKKSVGVEYGIVECLNKYGCSNFDEAWDKLVEDVKRRSSIVEDSVFAPQFLVIEEINRGNCAQIFGDLFQLLDRKNGYSEYPIEADDDIRKALIEDDPEGLSFGSEGLQLPEEIKNNINKICKSAAVADKVCRGELLLLPPNLYIWATMNTSDQSLFPIDSAFKRRWDWKYMPITKGVDKDGNEMNWSIVIGKKSYDWWEFLTAINEVIGTETQSEDKKLGFFFCKADANDEILADKFVNKVLFYLWNDVFKTCGKEYHYKDGDAEKLLTFDKFHTKDGFDVKKIQDWLELDLSMTYKIKETTTDAAEAVKKTTTEGTEVVEETTTEGAEVVEETTTEGTEVVEETITEGIE